MSTPKTLSDWLVYIDEQHWQNIDMGLSRMTQMLDRLSLTQVAKQVVTVAGTNGKGSTCIALEALLIAQGQRVGATLSPHVHRFNERIRLFGNEVDDETLCRCFERIETCRNDLPLTYFEYSALAALLLFAQSALDVAILEIGLGGRLDAFNAVAADVAIITSIGFDHQAFLGDTLEAIGAEKAGILRPGQTVVLGRQLPRSIHTRCADLDLHPQILDRDFSAEPFRDASRTLAADNLAVAHAAAHSLVPTSVEDARKAIASVSLPGRLQHQRQRQRDCYFDVAHNPQGISFLLAELDRLAVQPNLIIFGMLRGKDHVAVATRLQRWSSIPWVYVTTQGERGLSARELAEATGFDGPLAEDPQQAWSYIESATDPGDVILALGSFNVVEQFADA